MKSFSAIRLDVEALPEEQRFRILASLYARALFTKRTALAFIACVVLLLCGNVLEERFETMSSVIEVASRIIGFSLMGFAFLTGFIEMLSARAREEKNG